MSERDEFEVWWDRHGQFVRAGGGDYEKCFAYAAWNFRATPQQAVPALTEPVAWHIGNPDGTMNKLGAIYHYRQSAVDHFDSYGGDFNASIVPLYAAPQPSQEQQSRQKYQD